MVVNMNMHAEKEGNINQYLSDTIASVFDAVYTVDVENSTNRVLFASESPEDMDSFGARVKEIEDRELKTLMEKVEGSMEPYEKGGYLLTDDQAPVELLGMEVIDELIQDEVGYYKQVFKEEGIQGVLESF